MDLPNVSDELNAVAETSVSVPEDVCNRMKKNLTSFEKEHFSPKNVMPEGLCSAYFRTTEDLKFQDVLSAVTNSGVPAEEVRCIQYKKVFQFAKEVHVTFCLPTFCSRFVKLHRWLSTKNLISFYRPTAQLLLLVFLMRLLNLPMRPLLND